MHLNEAAGAADASRARLGKFCCAVRVDSRILLSADFGNCCQVFKLQTRIDSIPIAPHLPQPPASSFKRLYRTREEHRAYLHCFSKTRIRYSTNVYQMG
jgi:hypothetical protein